MFKLTIVFVFLSSYSNHVIHCNEGKTKSAPTTSNSSLEIRNNPDGPNTEELLMDHLPKTTNHTFPVKTLTVDHDKNKATMDFEIFEADSSSNSSDYDDYEYDLLKSYSLEDVKEYESYDYEESVESETGNSSSLARWSLWGPGYFERKCRSSCQNVGKPFSRTVGGRCQCLCPLMNADALNLCDGTAGKCDRFCASQAYSKGGDCIFNGVCFCYCKHEANYDPDKVYS